MNDDSKMEVVLIGAGGHARAIVDSLPSEVVALGYVAPEKASGPVLENLTWINTDDDYLASYWAGVYPLVLAAGVGADGSLALRRKLAEKYSDFDFATIVSWSAIVSVDASLGEGTVVMNSAAVNAGAVLGRHCVVNTGAIVEHDCQLGDNVFVAPGAVLCGGVNVGDNVFVGANATVRPGVSICSGAVIGMAAAVVSDIDRPGTYAGIPAKRIR